MILTAEDIRMMTLSDYQKIRHRVQGETCGDEFSVARRQETGIVQSVSCPSCGYRNKAVARRCGACGNHR